MTSGYKISLTYQIIHWNMSHTRILLFTNSNKSAQIEEDASDFGNFVSKMLSVIPRVIRFSIIQKQCYKSMWFNCFELWTENIHRQLNFFRSSILFQINAPFCRQYNESFLYRLSVFQCINVFYSLYQIKSNQVETIQNLKTNGPVLETRSYKMAFFYNLF